MKITTAFDAVYWGTYRDFKRLFDGDINQVEPCRGRNLLHEALMGEHNLKYKFKIVKFLLKKGIDVNHVDYNGKNVLHNFFYWHRRPDLKFALKVLPVLLKAGVDVNAVDRFGAIPLSQAIGSLRLDFEDSIPLYKLLLEYGSDYNIKDNNGKSCIDFCNEFGDIEVLELIERYGQHG